MFKNNQNPAVHGGSMTFSDEPRATTMNGKPVFEVPAKSVINFNSGFGHKKLCDSLTFTAGSACAYSCSYCYVEDLMRQSPHLKNIPPDLHHGDIVIRRKDAVDTLRAQLTDRHGRPKFNDPADRRVIYGSPLVDIAANLELADETIEICKVILELTHWQIRLLSKSNLLPRIAQALEAVKNSSAKSRVIYGVSTGTLDDNLARCFEKGTALVSKRLQSLYWLQDNGFRTFGMICPSLPMASPESYRSFARDMAAAIRVEKCEHVWAECMNIRGDSLTRTSKSLRDSSYIKEADMLGIVSSNKAEWQNYARATFEAHCEFIPPEKLRFLQYIYGLPQQHKVWWASQQTKGAILL
jgi:DNA repair photolyase